MNYLSKIRSNLLFLKAPHIQFQIISFVVIVTIGSILMITMYSYLEERIINYYATSSALAVDTTLPHHLKPIDYKTPMDKEKQEDFKHFLKNTLYLSDLVNNVKIWDTNGRIIYSDKSSLIGKKYKSHGLQNSLKENRIVIETDEHEDKTNRAEKHNEVIAYYKPIFTEDNRKPTGIIEVYISKSAFMKDIRMAYTRLLIILFAGFNLLFVALNWLYKRAHSKIISTNIDLKRINERYYIKTVELEKSYLETIHALSRAVEAKDYYTAGHSQRVKYFSLIIGKSYGLKEKAVKRLERAALFHDIGKIGINESILNKTSKLTDDEYEIVKKHSVIGSQIISDIGFLSDIIEIVKHHHERYDGSGYPDKLRADEIPLLARIIAVADTFDAMTTDRPHRKALSYQVAIDEIEKNAGIQFDPKVAKIFIEYMHKKHKKDFDNHAA